MSTPEHDFALRFAGSCPLKMGDTLSGEGRDDTGAVHRFRGIGVIVQIIEHYPRFRAKQSEALVKLYERIE